MDRDYYLLLGVGRYASQDEIRRAFHSRILLVHPDTNPGDRAATDSAREVIEAYRVLAEPGTRHSYDRAFATTGPSVTTYRASGSISSCWPTRAVAVMLFLVVSVGLIFAVAEALANRTPVFRPYLGVIDVSSLDHSTIAVVAAPEVSNCEEWYAAQQYRMSLASNSATRHLVEVYSRAARSASTNGKRDCARFYARCIDGIENSELSVAL